MNQTSLNRLTLVHPVLSNDIQTLDSQMVAVYGYGIVVARGLATWAEQDALYAQGRTTPGKIVTNARGGQSWHNYGLAVDCYPENLMGIIDWNSSHPIWKDMEAKGVFLGMESGANWIRIVDAPHFQLRGQLCCLGAPSADVQNTYQQAETLQAGSGLQAVWLASQL